MLYSLVRSNFFTQTSMARYTKVILVCALVAGVLGLIVWGVLSAPSASAPSTDDSGNPNSPIVYYYGKECPHCKDLEKFLEENNIAEKVSFAKKEVWHNLRNSSEMQKRADECGIEKSSMGVPFVWAEGKCFVGGPDAEKFFREKAGIQ